MEYIVAAIGVLVGVLFGLIFSRALRKKETQEILGTLVVDRSDPDGPFLFLELYSSIEQVEASEAVLLKVEKKRYLSQD